MAARWLRGLLTACTSHAFLLRALIQDADNELPSSFRMHVQRLLTTS
jgi:hypothetical protein